MLDWRARKRSIDILGQRMAYVEQGTGDPIIFLHGNPTSSFLWRTVMAEMAGAGRLLAPDLVGMGDSAPLPDGGPDRYTLAEHGRYVRAWIDAVAPEGIVTLVLHDWGGPLGFGWARRNADRVRAIAYMETIVRPMLWEEWPEGIQGIFRAMRSEVGEDLILNRNIFVERILPGSILRTLDEAEMLEYQRPFDKAGESRRPTLSWPRQIPLGGEPADAVAEIAANHDWLSVTPVPKLLVTTDPGAILVGPMLETARLYRNQSEAMVRGSHFIQEDSGAEIGAALSAWLDQH